jgi:hypothetical protein
MKSGVSMNTLRIMMRHTSKVPIIKMAKAHPLETVGNFISSMLRA